MIKIDGVTKSFDGTMVLKSIGLEIGRGKILALIGPSGCGKSTLIRIIAGLVKPDNGVVVINDEILTPGNVLSMRRRMGYVIQEGGLFPHLTARQNVALMARYLGRSKSEIDARMRYLAGLTKFPFDGMGRYPVQLSGGQNQRVSLMRALMLDPNVLLLDEPLAALDPLIRFELQRDLKEIFHALKISVVLVTHDMGEAAFFGDRIVLMKEGRIVQQGTLQDLVECPAESFVTSFIQAQRSPLERVRREGE
jgi:osmoprotectant transport system ATP-binding protein